MPRNEQVVVVLPVGLEVSGERHALRHPGRDHYRMSVFGSITFGGADNAPATARTLDSGASRSRIPMTRHGSSTHARAFN